MPIPLKKLLFSILLITGSLLSKANIDSLKHAIPNTSGVKKVNTFLQLSKEYRDSEIDSAKIYARSALRLSEALNEIKSIIDSKFELAAIAYTEKNYEKNLEILLNTKKLAVENVNLEALQKVHYRLGSHYEATIQFDSAIHHYQKSIDLSDSLFLKRNQVRSRYALGGIHMDRGNLESALEYYLEAYRISEKMNESYYQMIILLNIGIIYNRENHFDKAAEKYEQVLVLAKEIGRKDIQAIIYNNLAVIYTDLKKFEQALEYYQKSYKIKLELKDKGGMATALNNLGDLYYTLGKYDKALKYIQQSLSINVELDDGHSIIYNKETQVQIYLKTGEFAKIRPILTEALEIARKLQLTQKERDVLKLYSEYYFKTGNYKNAYTYLEEYNTLQDSILKNSRTEKIAQLQMLFETEKKEKANEILRVNAQLSEEKLAKEKQVRTFLIIFSILALILFILIVIFFVAKVKVNKRISKINSMLEESNQKLKVMNVTKDKFFSIIAHDLRAPFNAILGFSELIKDEINDRKDFNSIKDFNDSLSESAHSLFTLLENLLQWANSQRGELEYSPTRFDLYELIRSNMNLFSLKAADKCINLQTDIEPNTFVVGDENMVNTIIRNLLSNALKFTDMNGKIIISTKSDDDFVTIMVKDTGIGISKDNQDKLFRLDCNYSTYGTNDESGSGLGLILCKEFVEKNGGNIWVESELRKGSQFAFTLRSA